MTVIAWDGTTLAADRRSTNAGLIRTVKKIFRVDNKLIGCAGSLSSCMELLNWAHEGFDPKKFPACQRDADDWASMLMIEEGRVYKFERGPIPAEFHDPFVAIGSGRDFAIAAMHCGKSAEEAVEIASLYQCDCGNGVDTLRFEP